ncbi:MAG: histidine kinase, partial [Bacteroidales bacterium]|nr:histidine kinase [Bacteroidales bacterium]
MNRFLNIVTNPFVISIPVALLIIYFLPQIFNKYNLEIVKQKKFRENQTYYHDMNNDSLSEYFFLGYEKDNNTFPCMKCWTDISSNDSKVLINQFNSRRNLLPKHNLLFADFDNDKVDEIYFFEYSSDSLFLKGIDPMSKRKVVVDSFIAKVKLENDIPDFLITYGGFFDLNNNGYKEFIFCIRAGFSKAPRAIYAYDIYNDKLVMNDVKYAAINLPIVKKASTSGYVITVTCSTPENAPGPHENFYCDSISRLFVFNEKLKLLFTPIEQHRRKSNIITTLIKEGNELFIYALFNGETNIDTSWLIKYNTTGDEIIRRQLDDRNYKFLVIESDNSTKLILYKRTDNECFEVTPGLKFINKRQDINLGERIDQVDLNNDGKTEIITYRSDIEKIFIYQEGFSHTLIVDFPELVETNLQVSKCSFKDQKVNLYIQSKGIGRYYLYFENRFYYFKYPFYFGIYLLISLFLYILLKLQRTNLQKRFEKEKRMTELELLTIKNQIDPHFTFNAINTLSSVLYKEDKKKAHEFLVDFSSLIRNTLNNSKKISITLGDEIEFVENYLKLQQFRYIDKFDFSINIDEKVDMNTLVPRMIIQTFAENAVKHGLVNKEGKGNLEIKVISQENRLQIEIIDDGIGLKKSKQVKNYNQISTGKGHEIINQIVEMYNRLNNTEVSFEITDILNNDGISSG